MRYFTSDLHIGDKSVARWRGYDDIAEHDAMILAGLARLQQTDELWILGDICKANVASVCVLREAIACERVHIVVGNHDTASKFVSCGGFVSVDYYAQVGKVAVEGYKFVMSHYPMLDWDRAFHGSYMLHGHIHSIPAGGAFSPEAGKSGQPSPAADAPIPDVRTNRGFGLRGYNEWNRDNGIRRYDVGVDANGYLPVSAEQIVAFLPDDATWSQMHGIAL